MTPQRPDGPESPLCLAINGYGRIGRCVLRALHESPLREALRIVAINEQAELDSMVYLTRFDSTHGRFPARVEARGSALCVGGTAIPVSHAVQPQGVDWASLGADLVLECSGQYGRRPELEQFLAAGCPRLLLSYPGHSAADVDRTVVLGFNQNAITGRERIVSGASCTTNAIVPILALLDQAYAVEQAFVTTLHSVMNDQPSIDGYHHADLRRTRSAMQSMVPVATGLAKGIERLLPALAGRVQAKSIRVPVANVSALDVVVELGRDTDAAELNDLLAVAAQQRYAGIMSWADQPNASIDFNHSPHSAIVDGSQTRVSSKRLASLLVWFDNEWGFANRMIELAAFWRLRWDVGRARAHAREPIPVP